MSGEINGTPCIVQNSTGAIVGQGSLTHSYGGALIETTNQSNGDYITYMEGENSGKQHVFSGEFTYNSDAQFRKVRDDVFDAVSDTYTLTMISDATTDESFSGTFFPTGLTDNIGQGVKVTTSLSFNSSGAVTRTKAVT